MSAPGSTAVAIGDLRDTVRLSDSLTVDRAPVTNARYEAFVRAQGHRPPAYWPKGGRCPKSLLDHPVVGIDFFDAVAFALWAGGALPTELEWCQASGLEEHRAYVWGDGFDGARCNTVRSELKGTTPVDAYPDGAAPSGCVDLCGNVWEMTCTAFPEDDDSIIVKGGSWYDFPVHARLDARFRARIHKCLNTVGFRLVYGKPLELPPFLDKTLVLRCIAYRRAHEHAHAHAPSRDGDDGNEFEEIVAKLREVGADHLPALALPTDPLADPRAVENALAVFDQANGELAGEPPPAKSSKPPLRPRIWAAMDALWSKSRPKWRRPFAAVGALRAPSEGPALKERARTAWETVKHGEGTLWERLPDAWTELRGERDGVPIWDRMSELLERRPRTLFLLGCIAIGTVFGLAWSASSGDDKSRTAADTPRTADLEEPPKRRAKPRRGPSRKAAAPAPARRPLSKLDQAVRDIVTGPSQKRDKAEGYLIWHGDEAYPRVRGALKTKISRSARASLRYVLAAIDEERSGNPAAPRMVWDPPTQGLVVFCNRLDGKSADEIAKVRRTGKAERVDVTVVLCAEVDPVETARVHAATLAGTRLYVDRDGKFKARMRIREMPAVAGLREGGGTAFLLLGNIPRAHLAANAARLKTD